MTTPECQKSILDEVLAPHLASEDGQAFLAGQARLERVQEALSHSSPAAAEEFKALVLRFTWQQVSVPELQSHLRALISAHKQTLAQLDFYPTHIAPFLDIEIRSPEDEARARGMFCQAFGLVTQGGSVGAQGMMENGTRLVGDVEKTQQVNGADTIDVEERFRSQPGKYEHFLSKAFSGWREGDSEIQDKEEARRELLEMLEGEKDLLERAKEIWPINVKGGSGAFDTAKA